MDYYQQNRPAHHATQAAPQNYMYSQANTPSSSNLYYQQIQGYNPNGGYAIQPSVSQVAGSSLASQSVVSAVSSQRRPRTTDLNVMQRVPNIYPESSQEPLRMVVDAKYVGAIIGQQGNNIREITRESKAKCIVDSQKGGRDSQGITEKGISIFSATPEGASKAIVKILEVVEKEREKERDKAEKDGEKAEDKHEVELKLRAHNQLVGRLIGKQGSTIKKIMSETETVIFVSNDSTMQGMSSYSPIYADMLLSTERTITVRGATIGQVSAAEQKITAKLRHSFETDFSNRLALAGQTGGIPVLPNPLADAYTAALMGPRSYSGFPQSQSIRTVKVYVPNNMVGAIIGSKGQNIRSIMKSSSANLRIEGGDKKEDKRDEGEIERDKLEEKEKKKEEESEEEERMVTITGTDQQIFKAQFSVFLKVAEQGNLHFPDEPKLKTEITVPSRLVGRIIGKGGQNVRELQRITSAQVKIAEEGPSTSNAGDVEKKEEEAAAPVLAAAADSNGETVLRITGNINATVSVQGRISTLVQEFIRNTSGGGAERTPNGATAAATQAE